MRPSYRFYRFSFRVLRPIAAVLFRMKFIGRENITDGAAMVCANHSGILDPFYVAFAFGIDNHMHIIAKAELFRMPIVSPILKKLGMISVDRGVLDAATVKSTLSYLKNGEKIVIFPEGTRVSEDDAISAKAGAVKIAERMSVPLVPFFLPRKKPFFSKIPLVIGKPYYLEETDKKRNAEDYALLAEELMEKIKSLNPMRNEQREDFSR